MINANAYRLELPPMIKISSVVNISFLKPYRNGAVAFPARPPLFARPLPAASDTNGAKEYEVERIVAQRGRGAATRFLVYWKGYPLEEATWEPREGVAGAPDCMKAFHATQR